jgi:hypothetical protein
MRPRSSSSGRSSENETRLEAQGGRIFQVQMNALEEQQMTFHRRRRHATPQG